MESNIGIVDTSCQYQKQQKNTFWKGYWSNNTKYLKKYTTCHRKTVSFKEKHFLQQRCCTYFGPYTPWLRSTTAIIFHLYCGWKWYWCLNIISVFLPLNVSRARKTVKRTLMDCTEIFVLMTVFISFVISLSDSLSDNIVHIWKE